MRVLITGSREWQDRGTMAAQFRGLPPLTVIVHGDCRGADRMAAELAREFGLPVEPHPADWELHGASAGHRRNQLMVDLGADFCLAFPRAQSVGTHDCIRRAKAAGIPVLIFRHQD